MYRTAHNRRERLLIKEYMDTKRCQRNLGVLRAQDMTFVRKTRELIKVYLYMLRNTSALGDLIYS